MSTQFILDSEDWPVPSPDGLQWAEWHVANQGRCEIGRKAGTGFLVVTRFVGLDYNFTGKGEPLLYRTSLWMDGKYRQRLYATRNEAFKGHYLAVEEARRMTGREKKKLTVFNTNIRSASITIRMLTLEARKVTVSVFRQIEEEPIIDSKTLTLRGVPWGHVNYHWGDMNRNALHVLWQKGTELRRSLVHKLNFRLHDAYTLFKDQNLKLYKSKVPYLDLVANIGEGHPINSDDDHSRVGENTEGILFYADMPGWQYLTGSRQRDPMAWFTFPPKPMPPTEPNEPHELERYKRDFPLWQERVKFVIAMCRETMARRVDEIYARHVAYVQKHNELVEALKQTEQLFIALY